jgi:hypothetical protein
MPDMPFAASAATVLTIAFSASGGVAAQHWTLRCHPTGGTLPRAAAACAKLDLQPAPFAPTSPGTACTDIYGGPQTARVTGLFRGRSVWAVFARKNGCEIARWNRVRFLFPGSP